MAGVGPDAGPGSLPILRSHVQRLRTEARIVVTDFEPVPLGDVRGKDVFFTTTAPEPIAEKQVAHLEAAAGCRVVGWSARLADRAGLGRDIDNAEEFAVLLTELKAAAVEVACERAIQRGADVMFVDNRAVAVDGQIDLRRLLRETVDLAVQRSRTRTQNA